MALSFVCMSHFALELFLIPRYCDTYRVFDGDLRTVLTDACPYVNFSNGMDM